jgi:hypothetical protein
MEQDFVTFSQKLESVKSLDIISFKKLYNKKLNIFLHTKTEVVKNELIHLQLSFDNYFKESFK